MRSDFEDPEIPVFFHFEAVHFSLPKEEELPGWIARTVAAEGGQLQEINFIFCSDDYLLQLNVDYLDHDTFTDVITFPYLEFPLVEGDIFISSDRVADNAREFGQDFAAELHRVMIHGVLHLCGYSDKTPAEKDRMTQREDSALADLQLQRR